MASNLVIVESPAKAKTIQRFLGQEKDFSVDVEHGFKPIYEIPADKKELVKQLKAEAAKAQTVWLASDEDREGEAIAWHLAEVLNLKPENTRRIVFHEITKPAILEAIEHPRAIDGNLVDAQQARRVLDRIVGFELSPVLWRKIKPALSAGRVQSVAVRLIADREKEIKAFVTEQYYRITAQMLHSQDGSAPFAAELDHRMGTRQQAIDFLNACRDATFTVSNVQQEASRKLGFSVSQTMRVAQSLYEAGHITYMRTDSVNLSNLAMGTISKEIKENIGERYLKARRYHTTSKGAQEAHEAIRPTYIANHDVAGTAQEKKLYNLIWKRTIASQMADAELERTAADITVPGRTENFVATGEVVKFDGFLRVYMESTDDDNAPETDMNALPPLAKGMTLTAQEVAATQRFTQQPQRYTEATLVKRLEELGIGRPSTYAPTISTIQAREYVVRGESKGEKREYEIITLKGSKTTVRKKSELVGRDNFTAHVENEFDEIAAGRERWNEGIEKFYDDFHPNIEQVATLRLEHKVGERVLGNDPATGKPVSVKIGRYGPLVQLGSSDDDEKPRFASLQKDQSVASITLEEALKLFELPRELGDFEGKPIVVAVGRFGPYVKHDGKYASIPKEVSPMELTFEQACQLILDKRSDEASKVIKTFAEEPDLQVLNGRYGPYIAYKKKNYKIPKKKDAASLTLEECRAIINDDANAAKPATVARRRTTTRSKSRS